MEITVSLVVLIAACVCVVLSAIRKCPLWVPVMLLCVWALIQTIPIR